ncbi:MAG TPA: hypothetical protein VN778_04675, partial [Verrucomicrobiae bacterium]|nr:hypothetical protein [Verrucomicrobiae bacterium]
ENFNFLVISPCKPNVQGDRHLSVVGFGVSGWQKGTDAVDEVMEPITEYDDLAALGDPSLTSIDRIGKGIGPRLYNTPQALVGTEENPRRIGAYKLWLDVASVWDFRLTLDPETPAGQGIRIAKQAYFRAYARLRGERKAAQHIHSGHLSRQAFMHHQTPTGLRLEKQRRAAPSAIPEAFLVIRNPNLRAYKIGEYTRPT